jgi:hypothetical protein
MARKALLAGTVLVAGALLVANVAAAPAAKATSVNCRINLVLLSEPGHVAPDPTAATGHDFGTFTCGRPLGRGVQTDSVRSKPATPTTGTASGSYSWYLSNGTVGGPFKVNYSVTSATAVSYKGTYRITHGTGALARVRGHGVLNCVSRDGGVHTSCQAPLTLTSS